MKKLIIHLGHHKTGTSAIQSLLAANAEKLLEHGINYPFHSSFAQALDNRVSSGNGHLILQNKLEAIASDSWLTVYSGENLFAPLGNRIRRDRLLEMAARNGRAVEFVCYTRNYFEHTFSAWGELIKRGGVHSTTRILLRKNTQLPSD